MLFGDVAGRVLIVDDDQSICKLYKYALEKAGIGAHWVLSARDAEDAMKHGEFALALIDVSLGTEDGVALADRLVAEAPKLAVILMTGKQMDDVRSPYPVLEKPGSIHSVVDRVMVQLMLRWTRHTLIALDERIATWTVSNMMKEFLSDPRGKLVSALAGMVLSYAVVRGESFISRLDTVEKSVTESVAILKVISRETRK